MKQLRNLIILAVVAMVMTGCYSIKIQAPEGQKIQLASKSDKLPVMETYKVWYVLWGLIPLNENKTDKMIKENGLTSVRVETKFKFIDYLITAITGNVSIVVCTVILEGDRGDKEKKSNW